MVAKKTDRVTTLANPKLNGKNKNMVQFDNDDLEKEGIEITGSASVNPDAESEAVGTTPVADIDEELVDDELDADKLDIPYVDEDKGML
ncbi:MAG: hypothetical protein Q7S34_04585 [bacterium]|nr:hypothetical protein [bacterium]